MQVKVEPLVPAKIAALALGIKVRTLYKKARRARAPFPVYPIDGRLMFKLSEINAYIESRKDAKP